MSRRKAASDPATAPRPTAGGAYIRAADGTLERDLDTEQADATKEALPASSPEPDSNPASEQEA